VFIFVCVHVRHEIDAIDQEVRKDVNSDVCIIPRVFVCVSLFVCACVFLFVGMHT
jgi:hypothetical protein